MKHFFVFILLIFLASGFFSLCQSAGKTISKSDLNRLKQTYSSEAINYFYVTGYCLDGVGRSEFVSKWNKDIQIYLEGALWPNDSIYVKKAIAEINDLNLPVKLFLTNDTSLANMRMYFGNYEYLEKKMGSQNRNFFGTGIIPEYTSFFEVSRIGISNNSRGYLNMNTSDSLKIRQSTILEEIGNSLGITGDSWLHCNSLFFEGHDCSLKLSALDKEIICFLYEPCIPAKYPRKQFEKDFKDVLYHEDADKKIINYVTTNKIPQKQLVFISSNSSLNGHIYKFPEPIFVKLKGDYQKQDLEFCKKTIAYYNTISHQLKFEIAEDDYKHEVPCIDLIYNDSLNLDRFLAERAIEIGGSMFGSRVKGSIKLSYQKTALAKNRAKRDKMLFNALFKILGFDNANDDFSITDTNGNLVLKPEYKDVLTLLYNPVIPHDFTSVEMDKVIRALNRIPIK